MKILLINPLIGSWEMGFFPLGLGSIARVLLDSGHQVKVLDINAFRWDKNEIAKLIYEEDFDVCGIGALITQYSYVKWLCRAVRTMKSQAKIVVGGGLATAIPDMLLERTPADVAVIGEGEITAKELFMALENGIDLKTVKGICFKEKGELYHTAPREYIKDLDDVKFPAWHLFPMEQYLKSKFLAMRTSFNSSLRVTNLITSRGCPFSCRYCYHGIYGRQFRARSAENIIAEMKYLKNTYGVQGFMLDDDTFVVDRQRVKKFCEELINEKLKIVWSCNGRVNLMDEELVKQMKRAGCRLIAYGVESGNQGILDAMNRKNTVEQNRKVIEMTWRNGIIPYAHLMIGMIGETPETIKDTVKFCKEMQVGQGLGWITLYPGTPLLEQAKEMGKVKDYEKLIEEDCLLGDKLVVNLTNIPDDKLRQLRSDAEEEIIASTTLRRLYRICKIVGIKAIISDLYPLLRTTTLPKKLFRYILNIVKKGVGIK